MTFVKSPFFFRWLSPNYLLCDLPLAGKVIYLTFDDGPIPEATPEILGILKKHEAKATFFVVGDNVQRHPDIFESVKQAGHAIGNHTFHHLNGWQTSPGLYMHDVYRCREYFETRLFRPPYGRFTPAQYFLLRKDFRFVLWSVLTHDFRKNTTPEQCLSMTIDHSYGGAIVVFHDNLKSIDKVRYALPRFLDHFGELGFRFEGLRTNEK